MSRINLSDTEVYKHSLETRKLALALSPADVAEWLLKVGYYPEAYVLPPFFGVSQFDPTGPFTQLKPKKNGTITFIPKWSEPLHVSYPSDGLTSRTFSITHPHHYHDLACVVRDNYAAFVKSYKAKRIFSFTFPIPLDSRRPGLINPKRSERQIYEYIDAAEKKLLVDAADYKYVVVADIKQFYPSIYTHSIAWAVHTKKFIRTGKNMHDVTLMGNRVDKLVQASNDGKTNGIPIGPAVSDVISEWILNVVDDSISKKLPGRSFGIRFKDDYRIVCDTEEEGKQIIQVIQKELREFDLNLSDEKTLIKLMPDGLYRPWMLEYDHFIETLIGDAGRNSTIPFRKYQMMQRKIFEMNKEYSAKGVAEKFLGRLISDEYRFLVEADTLMQKKMIVANLIRLVNQKPKTIGQVLGVFELIIDKELTPVVQEQLTRLWDSNSNNEFMLCWLFYFMKKNGLKTGKVNKAMPLLMSLSNDSQEFYKDTLKDAQLITHMKDIKVSISEHVALFKKDMADAGSKSGLFVDEHSLFAKFIAILKRLLCPR